MLNNIPPELRALPQWVVADMRLTNEGKPRKTPLNPVTGQAANVTLPETWGTFAQACATGQRCIGFVLAHSDPFAIIDLDEPANDAQVKRHSAILAATNSYAEYSQSGNGVHIILRGNIPHGVRRDKVEIYSQDRYMICTGNVLRPGPVLDGQGLLDSLFAEMADVQQAVELVEVPETMGDTPLIDMADAAENGSKFRQLWQGNWKANWPSQSEADFALMSMLAFYSRSNEQCRRLFRASALGQRDKAQRDAYLNTMLGKIRAKLPPEPDFSLILKQANEIASQIITKKYPPVKSTTGAPAKRLGQNDGQHVGPPNKVSAGGLPAKKQPPLRSAGGTTAVSSGPADTRELNYPPGLFGDIARYFYASSIRPVREIAIVSALAAGAGVCGRSYNISGTGLNQYLILLASTGTGKEGAASAVDRLVAATRQIVPMADQFVGPGAFASGQALVRTLDTRPCFVSVLGEIGLTLRAICDPRADANASTHKRVLLDLYTKSGFTNILKPSVYSDHEKNTKLVQAPCVTLLGESTPDTFYGSIDHSHIADGLISRFSVIEYNGPRPARNSAAFAAPGDALVGQFADLVTTALTCQANNTVCHVPIDNAALALLDAFDTMADNHINGTGSEAEKQLWNRAHLKALKLAALLAVGCNHSNPMVDVACTEWAISFVKAEVSNMVARFKGGDVGGGENKQEADLRRFVNFYLGMPVEGRVKNYKVPADLAKDNQPVFGYDYLRRRAGATSSFRNDKRGARLALKCLLDDLVQSGTIIKLSERLVAESYKLSSPVYTLGASW